MKAGVIFTGTGPILILTSYKSLTNPKFLEKLAAKDIKKFFAFELPIKLVKKKYGEVFTLITEDLDQTDDLRVIDYNGHNIFHNFTFKDVKTPIFHE